MENKELFVNVTPIDRLFSKNLLDKMLNEVNPMPNKCYYNAYQFARQMQKICPTIDYCEGMIYEEHFVHSFNSAIFYGVRHYFDFSSYFLEKEYGYKRESNLFILLRQYTLKEISKTFSKMISRHHNICCTIDADGTFLRFLKDIRASVSKEEKEQDSDYSKFLDERIAASERGYALSRLLNVKKGTL